MNNENNGGGFGELFNPPAVACEGEYCFAVKLISDAQGAGLVTDGHYEAWISAVRLMKLINGEQGVGQKIAASLRRDGKVRKKSD